MVISMLKIRRPLGRLIFNMGIAIPGKTVFLIETAPRWFLYSWTVDGIRLNCQMYHFGVDFLYVENTATDVGG